MNYPPMVMRLKIKQQGRGVNLWLPLFILAPIATALGFAIFLILLPFILIGMIVFCRLSFHQWKGWRPVVFFWPVTLGCLIALRGLEVDVNGKEEKFLISFK